jgi:hypothetical protein
LKEMLSVMKESNFFFHVTWKEQIEEVIDKKYSFLFSIFFLFFFPKEKKLVNLRTGK